MAGGLLGLLTGGPGDLQRIIAEQAIALAACKEALEAKTIEMRTKIQDAMDLVSAVREASLGGAAEVVALLPLVGAFYTRRKDACSVCGSDNAVAYKVRPGTTQVVCSTACGAERQSVISRVKPVHTGADPVSAKSAGLQSQTGYVRLSVFKRFDIVRAAFQFAPAPSRLGKLC